MSEKAFILLLVVLVSMGIFSYQKALRERGGISPLQEYFGNSSRKDSEGKFWSEKVDSLNLQQAIRNFRLQLDEVDAQKAELLQKREKSLSGLLQSNGRIYRLAKGYLDSVLEMYQQFQDPYDEFKGVGKDIILLTEGTDLEERQRVYPRKKEELVNAITAIVGHEQHSALIEGLLQQTELIMTTPFDSAEWGCADMKACVVKNIRDIEQEINLYMNERIVSTMRQLEDIVELNRILEHEYKFLRLNTEGTNAGIEENDAILEEALDKALAELNDLTYRDLGELLKLIHLSKKELDAALSNLQEHHAHFETRFKEGMKLEEAIVKHLEKSVYFDFADLSASFQEEKPVNEGNYDRLKADSDLLLALMARDIEADESIIEAVAEHLKIDLSALEKELGLDEMAGNTELDPEALAKPSTGAGQPVTTAAASAQEQMKLMREKTARDDQILKKMFEVYGAPLH